MLSYQAVPEPLTLKKIGYGRKKNLKWGKMNILGHKDYIETGR